MTLQTYNKIKLLYSGMLSVELPMYSDKYKVCDVYRFDINSEYKGIIKKKLICKEYRDCGTIFLTIELI